ncbi:MAG: undecaprenyl-diphosphate phosphatase [Candidatus Eremiobacteraeota bacterium]|nr:undecaprenyl-diphosphate phosphatase [Candidatus Eremiobacteraeota bacterium]MBV9737156.1 undecaprenyl-diphosphate phosphatase [Candidatus Eremiobacteraeota bacterium]
MSDLQAISLAILQGVSELFPVSSLGHTILVPALLHWSVNRRDPTFLAFVVVLHLGTAIALVVFYRREWVALVRALVRSIMRGRLSDERDERIAWLLVVGSIPVGILGVYLESPVRNLLGSAAYASIFLMINALIMFVGEFFRKRQHEDRGKRYKRLEAMKWIEGVAVGLAQSLALLPGISRSGASIVAGLAVDLDHEDAARYSFLLATPVIGAAALIELPRLWEGGTHVIALQALYGGILAGIAAYLSVAFLTKYFQRNDLRPFGWYCLVFGALCLWLSYKGVIS